MSQKCTTVKQSIEAYVPSGASVVPKFSYDNTNWLVGTLIDETQLPMSLLGLPTSIRFLRKQTL